MSRTMRRVALLLILLLVVAGATGASATDSRTGGNRLTGCRNTTTGVLDQVKSGLLPMGGACGAGELMVTWNKTGPRGPQGPTGATGVTGATGANGVSGYEIVTVVGPNDSVSPKVMFVPCPAGKKVVGGGGYAYLSGNTAVSASWPGGTGAGWSVGAVEFVPTAANWYLTGYAICVTALP
jgi:hypothetical protein